MVKYLFWVGVCVVLGVLPSLHIIPVLELYDEKRIFQVALLLVIGALFAWNSGQPRILGASRPVRKDRWFTRHPMNPRPTVGVAVRRIGNVMYPSARRTSVQTGVFAQWGMAGFLVLGFISIWINGNWHYGLQQLSLYVLLFVFLLFTARTYREHSRGFTQFMAIALLLFGGLYALKFFIGYGMHWVIDYPLWPGERYENPFFGFANMRFLNQVQVWTLPLFVIWATLSDGWTCRPTGKKGDRYYPSASRRRSECGRGYFFFFLAAFWFMLIIRTASAGAILCLFVAPLITLLLFRKESHQFIKKYLYAFAAGFIMKLVLFDFLTAEGGIAKSYANSTGMGRLERWGKMIVDIFEKPILGYGPMSFAQMGGKYHAGHPHNSVLQIGYEFGLPAMLIAVGLIFWGLYKWFNLTSSNDLKFAGATSSPSEPKNAAPSARWACCGQTDIIKPLISLLPVGLQPQQSARQALPPKTEVSVGISTSLLAGLGYSLFSGVMVMPLSQLWMVLVAGWALGLYCTYSRKKKSTATLSGFRTLTGFVVAAAIIFMSYSMVQDVPNLRENQQQYFREHGGKYHPRFWQQGKIGDPLQPLPPTE